MVTRPFFERAKLFSFLVMFAASMIAGTHLYSQDEPTDKKSGPPEVKQHGEQNEKDPMGRKSETPPEVKGPEGMADNMSKMLTERLSLNEEQKTKVYDIILAYASNHDQTNFNHNDLDSQIETVLTADQKDKYREFVRNGPDRNAPPKEGIDNAQEPRK